MCKYIVTETLYKREEKYVNFAAFGPDLAKELGATIIVAEEGQYGSCKMQLGDLTLYVNRVHKAGRVCVTIGSGAESLKGFSDVYWGSRPNFPRAKVRVERDIKAIAKDVTRRVITSAQEPLQKMKDLIAKNVAQKNSLQQCVELLNKERPDLKTRINDDGLSAKFSKFVGNLHISGTVWNDGDVKIDGISTIDVAKLVEIMKVLEI